MGWEEINEKIDQIKMSKPRRRTNIPWRLKAVDSVQASELHTISSTTPVQAAPLKIILEVVDWKKGQSHFSIDAFGGSSNTFKSVVAS